MPTDTDSLPGCSHESDPGRGLRRVLRWARIDGTLAAIWLLLVVYCNSDAGPPDLPFDFFALFLVLSGLWLALAWMVRTVLGVGIHTSRARVTAHPVTLILHALIPLVGLLGLATAMTRLDTRARFALSRDAFDRTAASIRAGSEFDGPAWVGLYRVRYAYLDDDGNVWFMTRHAWLFTEYGFMQVESELENYGGSLRTWSLDDTWSIYHYYD